MKPDSWHTEPARRSVDPERLVLDEAFTGNLVARAQGQIVLTRFRQNWQLEHACEPSIGARMDRGGVKVRERAPARTGEREAGDNLRFPVGSRPSAVHLELSDDRNTRGKAEMRHGHRPRPRLD